MTGSQNNTASVLIYPPRKPARPPPVQEPGGPPSPRGWTWCGRPSSSPGRQRTSTEPTVPAARPQASPPDRLTPVQSQRVRTKPLIDPRYHPSGLQLSSLILHSWLCQAKPGGVPSIQRSPAGGERWERESDIKRERGERERDRKSTRLNSSH